MDEDRRISATLIEFAVVSSAATAAAAFLAAFLALLTEEFINTRIYLFGMALAFALVACALVLGIRLSRHAAGSN